MKIKVSGLWVSNPKGQRTDFYFPVFMIGFKKHSVAYYYFTVD